jgi:hypothetical protein
MASPDSEAGSEVMCGNHTCRQRLRVPGPASKPIVVQPLPTHDGRGTSPPVRPSPQVIIVAERCYECGRTIPEGQVYRWSVAVASAYVPGVVTSYGHHHSYSYGRVVSQHARVSLCEVCAAKREQREKVACRVVLVVCVLLLLLPVALIAVIAFLVWWGSGSH